MYKCFITLSKLRRHCYPDESDAPTPHYLKQPAYRAKWILFIIEISDVKNFICGLFSTSLLAANWLVVICGDLVVICGDLMVICGILVVICGDLWWFGGNLWWCSHLCFTANNSLRSSLRVILREGMKWWFEKYIHLNLLNINHEISGAGAGSASAYPKVWICQNFGQRSFDIY